MARIVGFVAAALVFAAACSMVQPTSAPLGTEQNPVKFALAPATDAPRALAAGAPLVAALERETGLRIKLSVPTSQAAVIEAMGTHNVDVAWLSPLGYILAHDRLGVVPLLADVRAGSVTSVGHLVVRADDSSSDLEALHVLLHASPVPHDTVSVRKGIPPEIVQQVRDGLQGVAGSSRGAALLRELSGSEGLGPVADGDYAHLRAAVELVGLDLDAAVAPPRASGRR